jgi:DNA-binding NtrC family response regulator
MRILLGSMGCDCTVAWNMQKALATMEHANFDAIVLDPQSSGTLAAEMVSQVYEFRPKMLDQTIVITDEHSELEIKELLERHSFTEVQRKFLLQQLWSGLESLSRPGTVFQNLEQEARLISDSFHDPLPAGARSVSDRSRRLLYASRRLRVDLLVEPEEGSNRVALAGQILDSVNPARKFDGVPVTVRGWKGFVAQATAGEFGEFQLNFNLESNISLEIRIGETQEITIPLPAMGRARRSTAGYS